MTIAPFANAQETKKSPTESGQVDDSTRRAEREAMYYRYLEFASYVKGGSVQAHWMADGSSFWYAEGAPANTLIYKINPSANTKTPLFDTARLRKALTPLLGHEPPYKGLPFEEFTFVDGEKAVKFAVENKEFILQLDSYTIARAPAVSEEERSQAVPRVVRKAADPFSGPDLMEVLSPDRRWFAGVKDHNLYLRSTSDGRSVQLTTDGIKDYEWSLEGAKWSPDSLRLLVRKVDSRKVPKIPIVQYLKPRAEVEWVPYAMAGGPIEEYELFIVDVLSKRQIRLATGDEPIDYFFINPGWRPEGSELLFQKMYRGYKKLELMAASPQTGATRVVLTETQKTFLIGLERFAQQRLLSLLQDGKRFIWISDRDGWRHLYLYDLNGKLIRRLTEGAFPVVRVVGVDEKAGWIYFAAHGNQQRPYDTHLYRVNMEGKEFTRLTEASGQHDIQLAPSKQFFLDTHSSVDRPPITELRQADGTLLQIVSKANIDALKELKWNPPEEFVVKAADGKTDLYGVLFKPYDFDPNKKYPVIEVIFAGPQSSVVPKTFTFDVSRGEPIYVQAPALAQLGFIVFVVDGRGTPERGKAFQDATYGNIGRLEIPDHVAALKQLAEKRSYMDLSRAGILGHSFGGYFTIRAMLLASDVYHVGIASAPVGELHVHWAGTEAYMDLPQNNKAGYEYASNLRLAGNLKGKLLLIHGTSDDAALFSDTIKMVEALIRAGKPYDLIVLPEKGHASSRLSVYWRESVRRYFQEHLKP